MKNFRYILLFLFICSITMNQSHAEIKLPAIISSDMVLQRNTTITLWGWAAPKEKIIIENSWLESSITSIADSEGKWEIKVKTTNSKKTQQITLKSDESSITLSNILFGEVWLCSGQSNMERNIQGCCGEPVIKPSLLIAKSNNPNLRLFKAFNGASKTPKKDLGRHKAWGEASPGFVSSFSAVAYFYGKELQEMLDCPVGIILSAWSGSKIEAWISEEALKKHQEIDLKALDVKTSPNHQPILLYNAMIHPIIPYTIKGALWYQGESNREEPKHYTKLLPSMVKDWRSRWGQGNFPFYLVQIAPYKYLGNQELSISQNSAFMREAQHQCATLIPNAGIAITTDIGSEHSIHPPKKKEVADRLLLNALNKTYGYTAVDCKGPTYDTHYIKDQGIYLKFKEARTGLYSPEELTGFEIAGKDKVFYPAKAIITNKHKEVFVKSERVKQPIAVRYAWRNYVNASLYDLSLLPASTFRTDQWDDATHVTE